MSNKKIDINPDLFNVGGSLKTKKNRKRQQTQTIVPLISPNVLKNKLLKRIKEHKMNETENLVNNTKKPLNTNLQNNSTKPNLVDLASYTDEFNDSINYLQTLSAKKKVDDQKNLQEVNRQKMNNELDQINQLNIKNSLTNLPVVNIDLPDELSTPLVSVNTSQMNFNEPSISLNPYKVDPLPYGCLKNGIKPTYKDWNKTQKNYIVTNPNLSLVVGSNITSNISSNTNERENRLHNLKNKIKEKQLMNQFINNNNTQQITTNSNNTQITGASNVNENNTISIVTQSLNSEVQTQEHNENQYNNNIQDNTNEDNNNQEANNRKFIKKTIRRKYTLGKFKNKNCVGILLKDRNTRKQVLTAHRELKKRSINDIKSYLKDHNLIKVGSNAPNDVIRKIYESSMLAGEITNKNTDILLHNLMKDDKEL
jgi:hypothetical protein